MGWISRIFACMAAASLALCLCACGGSNGQSGSSSASTSASSTASTSASSSSSAHTESSSSSDASASSSTADPSASQASESAAGFAFVDECTDEHGNVSLYALTELKGWQLATLLDQQGYQWNGDTSTWTRAEDGASFAAQKETGPYTIDDYNAADEKGGGISAVGFVVVAGYPNAQAALSGNARCVVEDSYFDDSGAGMAVFYGPSMKEYLAIIAPYTESTTSFMVLSKEAVGSGLADKLLNTETGGTFEAMWKSVTGKDSIGN